MLKEKFLTPNSVHLLAPQLPEFPANAFPPILWPTGLLPYKVLTSEKLVCFRYADMDHFEIPHSLRANNPLNDATSINILLTCIKPCILPTGLSTSNRSQQPSY